MVLMPILVHTLTNSFETGDQFVGQASRHFWSSDVFYLKSWVNLEGGWKNTIIYRSTFSMESKSLKHIFFLTAIKVKSNSNIYGHTSFIHWTWLNTIYRQTHWHSHSHKYYITADLPSYMIHCEVTCQETVITCLMLTSQLSSWSNYRIPRRRLSKNVGYVIRVMWIRSARDIKIEWGI